VYSVALNVALVPLNELSDLQRRLNDDVVLLQRKVCCCIVPSLHLAVKAPTVLRQRALKRAGRAPALATHLSAGMLIRAFLALLDATGERIQLQAAVLQLLDSSVQKYTVAVGGRRLPRLKGIAARVVGGHSFVDKSGPGSGSFSLGWTTV
jgi:hypothetical protein